KRISQALKFLGEPLTQQQQAALDAALKETDDAKATAAIQRLYDSLCLAGVNINAESRVKVSEGAAPKKLNEQGWRVFLVKVHNQAGVTAPLQAASPNAAPLQKRSRGSKKPENVVKPEDIPNRWLSLRTFTDQPLKKDLSGLAVEYRVIQLYSRDAGKREARFAFDVGQGTQDLGFRNAVAVLFDCAPAVKVTLEIIDHDGKPTTGQFVIRDQQGRVYPARSRRLAPDFFFHDQIYRHSGEHVLLPPGEYNVMYTRGPEYRILHRKLKVAGAKMEQKETFRLQRWIKLTDHRWFSGDHHIHAAGCAHYESPTEGVTPKDMMRHILGEDLNVGCVLSWGPCWYYQKDFFSGEVDKLSQLNYLMRYDVEVSGFPSSHAGHLCLLNLEEDDYTHPAPVEFDWQYENEKGHFKGQKTSLVGEWPSWDLPVLKWGKDQGGVVGFSHSGWGLQLPDYMPNGSRQFPPNRWGGANSDWKGRAPVDLPDYAMPRFNGIGANEYVVDVVHDVCDFISAVDTPSVWELNVWYHTLNCGYTCRISGETDFPCIYGDRVGLGRVYVKLDSGKLNYTDWIHGIRDGKSYCSDGLSHLYDFEVNGLGVGEKGDDGRTSFLATKKGGQLKITAKVAALLDEYPREDIRSRRLDQKPYWHVERARVGKSRKVPVELIVNGHAVERKEIVANGKTNELTFNYTPKMSSWVALRIFPSSHTNPVFVEVDGQPIRTSKKSAKWCLEAVDVCWQSKVGRIRQHERKDAAAAFAVAKKAYREILKESHDDLKE
ncbi:MAG: CehA/McbA family metallohydrolase, partial [Planctomycetes bacterium]|nr:CehA/McbA family metallohydrolase [Planctomycetota bacterium]